MPWGEGKGVSWAVEYLRTKHGLTAQQAYRQRLTRAADAGRIRAERDWGFGTERRPRWLFDEASLDLYADEIRRRSAVSSSHGATMTKPPELMSIQQVADFLAAHDVEYSRESVQRLCRLKQLGQKVGSQYVITEPEAQLLLESLTRKGS